MLCTCRASLLLVTCLAPYFAGRHFLPLSSTGGNRTTTTVSAYRRSVSETRSSVPMLTRGLAKVGTRKSTRPGAPVQAERSSDNYKKLFPLFFSWLYYSLFLHNPSVRNICIHRFCLLTLRRRDLGSCCTTLPTQSMFTCVLCDASSA